MNNQEYIIRCMADIETNIKTISSISSNTGQHYSNIPAKYK